MKYTNSKKGVSLIVLVLTIMIVIVLAGAVLLVINNNNPMVKAQEATYKQNLRTFADEFASNNIGGIIDGSLEQVSVNEYNAIKQYIPCFSELYKDEIVIYEGEVCMLKTASELHKQYAREVGIRVLGDEENIPEVPDVPNPDSIPVAVTGKLGVLIDGSFIEKTEYIRQQAVQFVVEFKNKGNDVAVNSFTKKDIILNGFTADVREPVAYQDNPNKFLVTLYNVDTIKGDEGRKSISIAEGVAKSSVGKTNKKATTEEFNLIAPNYSRPPMPNGFSYVTGSWWTAYIIQDKNGNQFVWVPSGSIKGELGIQGNISTIDKNKQFGLRAWKKYYDGTTLKEDGLTKFSNTDFNDWNMTFKTINGAEKNYTALVQSVEYYGGYYLARYEAGKGPNDTPTSKIGMDPWVNISGIIDVKNAAESMGAKNGWPTTGECVASSILPFGSHYDTYFAWLIDFRSVNKEAIESNSGAWGNYRKYDSNGDQYPTAGTGVIQKTGSNDAVYGKNGISDLAGNVYEYTSEKAIGNYRTLRGGSFKTSHTKSPAAGRYSNNAAADSYGFRTALYLSIP